MDMLADFVLTLALKWWRVTASVAVATSIAWMIDTYTSVHSVRLTYSLMFVALVGGIFWHRKGRSTAADVIPPKQFERR
jgi:hypothetical protein